MMDPRGEPEAVAARMAEAKAEADSVEDIAKRIQEHIESEITRGALNDKPVMRAISFAIAAEIHELQASLMFAVDALTEAEARRVAGL